MPRKNPPSGDSPAFWRYVTKTETCWVFAQVTYDGYGRWADRGAHRLAYEALVGPIPEGLQLDHLCRVRNCVNPEHLEPVTPSENMRRAWGSSDTHCRNGHPRTDENTYIGTQRGKPHRFCRACNREAQRRSKARRAGAA